MWMEHAQTNYAIHWSVFPGHGRPTIKHGQEWWKTQKERALVDFDMSQVKQTGVECLEEVAEVKGRCIQFLKDNDIDFDSLAIKIE